MADLPDTNIWLALVLPPHPFHLAASRWFATHSTRASVLYCTATLQSFLRLLTNASVMRQYGLPPFSNAAAWERLDDLRADHRIGLASEPGGLESHWRGYSSRQSASTKLWMDAYLAAFAVTGKYRLVTTDQAFSQFRGLSVLIVV